MLTNDVFGFLNVKWLHLTIEVDKCKVSCQIFSGFNVPQIIKIGQFLTELLKNKKVDVFMDISLYKRITFCLCSS